MRAATVSRAMVSRVALRTSELDVGDFLGKIEIGEID